MSYELLQQQIEHAIREYPVCQYIWGKPSRLVFKEEVRKICEMECERYGKSWSCPPAVGTVQECKRDCLSYEGLFAFTTLAEVTDAANMDETLRTRAPHEAITRKIETLFREYGQDTKTLSVTSCSLCNTCTYPDGACRHPELMYPCIESQGILVTAFCESAGIEFISDSRTVTWFSVILFRNREVNLGEG